MRGVILFVAFGLPLVLGYARAHVTRYPRGWYGCVPFRWVARFFRFTEAILIIGMCLGSSVFLLMTVPPRLGEPILQGVSPLLLALGILASLFGSMYFCTIGTTMLIQERSSAAFRVSKHNAKQKSGWNPVPEL